MIWQSFRSDFRSRCRLESHQTGTSYLVSKCWGEAAQDCPITLAFIAGKWPGNVCAGMASAGRKHHFQSPPLAPLSDEQTHRAFGRRKSHFHKPNCNLQLPPNKPIVVILKQCQKAYINRPNAMENVYHQPLLMQLVFCVVFLIKNVSVPWEGAECWKVILWKLALFIC